MKRLVIISCGERKIWDLQSSAGPTPARDVYVSPYFRDNRRYAELFGDRWLILSSKYGFTDPDFVIPGPYEVTFKRKRTNPIGVEALAAQVRQKGLTRYDLVEVLGGQDYAERARAAFDGTGVPVACPIEGLRLGEGWQRVQQAIRVGHPLSAS